MTFRLPDPTLMWIPPSQGWFQQREAVSGLQQKTSNKLHKASCRISTSTVSSPTETPVSAVFDPLPAPSCPSHRRESGNEPSFGHFSHGRVEAHMQKVVAAFLASLLMFPAGSLARLTLTLGVLALASGTAAAQHPRTLSGKSSSQTEPVRPITSPQATISGPSSGVYCPDMVEKAVGLHDLGWLPAGRDVTVVVDAVGSAPFDPVATVLVVSLGVPSGGTAKTTTFYDNDSGGDKDPQIAFTTPQDGTYFLLVGENSGSGVGCYRYQLSVR